MFQMTYEGQIEALAALVDDWAVKRDPNVKGPFTSGDFVTWRLSCIFGPGGWSFTILAGPEMTTLNDKSAYVRVVGRLAVTFANGQTAHQDDVGIWPLKATRGGDLSQTAAERYETVEKAARTDCLKNAARNLGTCFAPLGDLELEAHIRREAFRATSSPPPDAATAYAELYDDAQPAVTSVTPSSPTPSPVNTPTDPPQATDPRGEFYAVSGEAIREGGISAQAVNDLVRQANGDGCWADALVALKAQLA